MSQGGRSAHRFAAATLAAALLVSAGAPATAAPDKPAAPAASRAELRQREEAARLEASKELGRLALFDVLKNAFDEARHDYGRALAFAPGNAALTTELAKLKGRTSSPSKADLDAVAERRATALAKCTELVEPAAAAYAQADCVDELGAVLALLRAQGAPVDGLVKKLDLVVFEPYLDLRTKSAVAKLDAGWEYVDGDWLDPTKVAAEDKAHSTWKSPWVFSDEVHQVRTNLPRRRGKQVLAHAAAYRNFFVSYFAGEWELVPPKAKLPIFVTRTRDEMDQISRSFGQGDVSFDTAAYYLHGRGAGNPCLLSMEMRNRTGDSTAVDFTELQEVFEHELGHQIGFEYSKFAASPVPAPDNFHWVVEGVADFLPNYDLVDGEWKLRRPRWRGKDPRLYETAFGWCREHIDRIPPLTEFVGISETFLAHRNYAVANAFTGYLLEGKNREYRQRFVDLIQAVHRETATEAALAVCFPDDSLYDVDAEFRLWLKNLELDDD